MQYSISHKANILWYDTINVPSYGLQFLSYCTMILSQDHQNILQRQQLFDATSIAAHCDTYSYAKGLESVCTFSYTGFLYGVRYQSAGNIANYCTSNPGGRSRGGRQHRGLRTKALMQGLGTGPDCRLRYFCKNRERLVEIDF